MSRARIALVIAIVVICGAGGALAWRASQRQRPPQYVKLQVAEPQPPVLATFKDQFRCTIYYTPLEMGFNDAGGFNMKPETRSGLNNREFPRDFLLAVEKEGFGKMREPIGEKHYVQYYNGEWHFAPMPVDRSQNPLVPKKSCAISKKQKLIPAAALLSIAIPGAQFETHRWSATDTGSDLEENQIDLYWGEDEPLGPGERLFRPKGAPFPPAQLVTVSILK